MPLCGIGFGNDDVDSDVCAQTLSKVVKLAIEEMTKAYTARVVKSGLI